MKKIIQLALIISLFAFHSTLIKSAEKIVHTTYEQTTADLGKQLRSAAARNDLTEASDLLLIPGIDVNDQNNISRWTALHLAAYHGHTTLAKLLLDNGASVNIQSSWESTPLHVAAFNNRTTSVTLLLQHGADLTIQDDNGNIALHKAILGKSQECFKVLLKHNSPITLKNHNGDTALHVAVACNALPFVQLLLDTYEQPSVHLEKRAK